MKYTDWNLNEDSTLLRGVELGAMSGFYDYMKIHPALIKAYQSDYNDFSNSSFFRK